MPELEAEMKELSGFNFLLDRVMAYREAKVLLVANKYDLFTLLDKKERTVLQIAKKLCFHERPTAILLNALVSMGLLCKKNEKYSNSPLSSKFLVKGKKEYKGNNLKFQEMIWECWSGLESVLQKGKPVKSLYALLSGQDPKFVEQYIEGMDNIAKMPADFIAKRMPLAEAKRMIDIGGGPATFTRAFVETNENLSAVVFDLPETLKTTRKFLSTFPAKSRIRCKKGDYTKDSFGRDFDFVWMSHITHDESPDTNTMLLSKAVSCLRPGGIVAIHDFVVDDDGCGPLFSALFGVNMLVYTDGGACYSEKEYRKWMKMVGLASIKSFDVLKGKVGNPTKVIYGVK